MNRYSVRIISPERLVQYSGVPWPTLPALETEGSVASRVPRVLPCGRVYVGTFFEAGLACISLLVRHPLIGNKTPSQDGLIPSS